MIDPEAEKLHARKLRKWTVRRISIIAVLVLLLGAVSAHDAGYAVLIGGATTGETTQGGMAHLNCTYFTGTEKVINHMIRPAADAARATRCPLVTRLTGAGHMSNERDDQGGGPTITIEEGSEPAPSTTPAPDPAPNP